MIHIYIYIGWLVAKFAKVGADMIIRKKHPSHITWIISVIAPLGDIELDL